MIESKMTKDIRNNRKFWLSVGIIFIFILVLNVYTKLCEDDYAYSFSMVDRTRIRNIGQIFSSLYFHAFNLNGRLFAHFWVFFFLMIPKAVFNVINSGMFCLFIYLICWIIGRQKSIRYLWLVFALVWVTVPSFGQVFLWLDGSCNYSWGMVFGLCYLILPVCLFKGNDVHFKAISEIGLLVFAFYMGGYNENISFICLIMACILTVAARRENKVVPKYMYVYLAAALLGWIVLLSMPAEHTKVSSDITKWVLYANFLTTAKMIVKECWFIVIVWVVLFALMLLNKKAKREYVLPGIFFLGAVASNEMFIMASYYEGRSMICTAVFLIISCGFMFGSLETGKNQKFVWAVYAFIAVMTGIQLIRGVTDIAYCYAQTQKRIAYIEEEKNKGNYDLVLEQITCRTKYPSCSGLKKLNTEDKTAWQNGQIEQYFELDSVLGKPENK